MTTSSLNGVRAIRDLGCILLALSVSLAARATELAVDELNNRDVILHLPLDADFHSISNAAALPDGITTNLFGGGSVTFMPLEVEGQYVVDSVAAGRGRTNDGYLRISKANVLIDISKFGIGYGCTNITVEGYIRGTYPSQIADWQGVFSIGVTNSAPTSIREFSTYYFLASATATKDQLYLRADGHLSDGSKAGMSKPVDGGLNGEWHHFAAVIEMMSADWAPEGGLLKAYLDHKHVGDQGGTIRWHGHSDVGDGQKMYLMIGGAGSTVDLDELRISKGSLDPRDFLRLRAKMPTEGEPIFNLSFDDLSVHSSVFNDDPEEILSGTPAYDTDVPKPFVSVGLGTEMRANTHSLVMDSQLLKMRLNNWLLGRGGLRDLTIEFFIKGAADPAASSAWKNPFQFADADSIFPFLLQLNGSKMYYLRSDAPYWNGQGAKPGVNDCKNTCNSTVAFNDGKWHHVALTVKDTGNGTSKTELFLDHNSVSSKSFPNSAWRGLGRDGFFGLGDGGAGKVWIDEVRITNGVLTKEQFLYARSGGMMIIFR